MNNAHISQPPVALLPDLEYGSPAEPPSLRPDVAPPPRCRFDKPCPLSHPPSEAAVGAPMSLPPPARTPVFFPAKPPSPARPPRHSHAKPPSIDLAKPPALLPAEPPTLLRTKPPALSPEKAPLPHPHSKPPASFVPAKPPILSPSPAQPPCLLAKPPAHAPTKSPAKPPSFSPAKPPEQSPAQPPRLSPFKPPPYHAIPPVAIKPPSFAPAKPPAPPPAQPPRLSPIKPPEQAPAKPPALPPASSAANKNGSAGCSNVFDVRTFGASGNGSCADDTRAFRAAWKAACSAESATLLVPSDGLFTVTSTMFSGPCKPGLTFQIDGVLMPPDGPASWPAADSRRQWITFNKTDGMTLTGRGTIEGNGEEWWNLPCKPHRGPNGSTLTEPCDSPALVRFFASSNVTVQGLRIENSPQFHLKFDGCNGVRVDGILLSSPAFSPNTDGVHVENTRNVQIYNSRINNGDDCVSIGAGCSNVQIENVTCGHGHGISIGSLGVHNTRACVSNVTVRNARIVDSDNGLRIKTWQGGAGSVTAVEFAGVWMENVRSCIVIDQYYCLGSGCANQTSAVRVTDVAYRDIRGTYDPRFRGGPIRFACNDSVACTDITMTDVELRPADGGSGVEAPLANPYCWNAYGLTATLTVPPVHCLQQGRPESLQDQLPDC